MAETEIHKLYNGEIELTFYPNSHQYKIDKKNVPSVTSITGLIDKSRPLLIWAERLSRESLTKNIGKKLTAEIIEEAVTQHSKIKKEAADAGTMVHDYAESYIKARINGEPIPEVSDKLPQEAINGILAFLKWNSENQIIYFESERLIYSKQFGYCGKVDGIAEVNGEMTVIDFKTGNAIYPEMWIQVDAYRYAYEEETGHDINLLTIMHFNKETGNFEVKEKRLNPVCNYIGAPVQLFVSLMGLKNFLRENKNTEAK